MEMDWREILRFSEKELKESEKDKLCENLSWMEVDDVELNFTDLKILFKLAQDVLKYKNEQVNSVMNKLNKTKKKIKTKERSTIADSPALSSDEVLETIEHQEEVIKANKDILEQLYIDIAELEGKKNKYEKDKDLEKESVSSRATLSEMNAIANLENEVAKKNRHIRKLLNDVKILEEENATLKEKLMVFKDKLKESTLLIENLTEQLFNLNNESAKIRDSLGKTEQEKANMQVEIETLENEIKNKHNKTERNDEDIKIKLQHFKNLVKTQRHEIGQMIKENTQLKEDLERVSKYVSSPKERSKKQDHSKNLELQEKLSEASQQMIKSAKIIQTLKEENEKLKTIVEDIPEHSISEQKNESDDGKERNLINKLKRKIKCLNVALQGSEEMLTVREKEITEIAAQLQLLRSDEGINALIESIKSKKKHLRIKDEGIKSLVQEVNKLNDVINEIQLENETMREKLNLPDKAKIETHGILKKYKDLEIQNSDLIKKVQDYEDRLITIELDNREKRAKKLKAKSTVKTQTSEEKDEYDHINKDSNINEENLNLKNLLEENEGLRNALTDILNLLKDNKSTAGVLLLECPSLEEVLNSMEARKASGWFSPHMKTVMELKAALGGKDALLRALHESRQETFDVLKKLEIEKKRYSDLEEKLKENDKVDKVEPTDLNLNKFGSWMTEVDFKNLDINDTKQISKVINKGNVFFENDFKQTLKYFQEKFCLLFDKFTSLSISASDDCSKWTIQEEQYKAEIENLKSQIDEHEDDSNLSPGLLTLSNTNIERKYSYLEELYKKMRTEKENIKNEYLESKRERMDETSEYERKIQNLLISVLNLTDSLRNSIPLEMFLKQNEDLNKYIIKYRHTLETNLTKTLKNEELFQHLDEIKLDILNRFYKEGDQKVKIEEVEQNIHQEQLSKLGFEITVKNNEIEKLQNTVLELQLAQSQLADKTLSCNSNQYNDYKNDLDKRNEENRLIKEQYQETKTQLDKTFLELQSYKQKELANDIEINMLRHQILDLQSLGDNKAIIARLSGEVLLAQLQVTESYEKIDSLKIALNKEKQLRAETEDIFMSRQKVFEIYTKRNANKFRVMSELTDTLRQQYQGCVPLVLVETFVHKLEEIKRKSNEANEKLNDIEDLQSNLMTKYSIYTNILDLFETKCLDDDTCPHKIKILIAENIQKHEIELCKKKLVSADEAYKTLLDRCDYFEKTLISVNQGFNVVDATNKKTINTNCNNDLKLENVPSEDEMSSISSCSRKSRTFTLSPPKETNKEKATANKSVLTNIEAKKLLHQQTQTNFTHLKKNTITQTDDDHSIDELKTTLNKMILRENEKDKIIEEIGAIKKQKELDLVVFNKKYQEKDKAFNILSNINLQKDELIKNLQETIQTLKKDIDYLKSNHTIQINKMKDAADAENQSVIDTLKKIEIDKNSLVSEYKELLERERQEYSKSVKELHGKVRDLQKKLEQKDAKATTSEDAIKETNKYYNKISDLETKIFKLQSDFDSSQAELISQQGELDRWKILASERLTKMEQLSSQLKERHNHEMESYKAENQHWLSQLNETQREHMELRNRLTEQKTLHMRQIAEKDSLIDRLRSVINNLKSQILNMQTMLTVNDPSFDLSAIVEVDEVSETISHQGSDRLELKFESTVDLTETEEEIVKMPSSSTAIWQEPLIDRLRREKQLIHKQNLALRRQVKVLASRERRARLDSQNLKNQVFRISTSGSKTPSVESRALQSKVASLQAQLTGVRRDAASSLALWDKWKRAQQSSDRWQMRYEEKCQETTKLEMSLNLMKSAVSRLEKEKRVLLLRLTETKQDKQLSIEKQDSESSEKALVHCSVMSVSSRALVERVEAQQRRIVALELAEKGNEILVSEYERSLAEITSLKGQVLKLESTLLEAQIRSPLTTQHDAKPEVDYWKNYCDMLKEENMQLTMKVTSMESVPTSDTRHRVHDLEQTVLTLRGLVSKLQAEKSSSVSVRKCESRPSSGQRSDKVRTQMECYRTEISNLKRTIVEKDSLLERSRDMLRVAADREEDLLRENTQLRRRLEQLTEMKDGCRSA